MDWNQLEYFKTVAQMQHVTLAAEKLMISQSALSRSIANLEKELGFPLFNRSGKNIMLNTNGQIFLNYAERSLKEITVGRKIIMDSLNPGIGNIAFAFLRSLGTHVVPKLLVHFRTSFPEIQFKLYENSTLFLLEQLLTEEIDLCLCTSNMMKDHLEWKFLFSEELFVAVPARHHLASKSSIELAEIATEPLITLKSSYGLRLLVDRFFNEIGIRPLIAFEGEEILTIAGLVEAELGVSLIPKMIGLEQFNIVLLPVTKSKCVRNIGLCWNKKHYLSPSATKFKDFVIRSTFSV